MRYNNNKGKSPYTKKGNLKHLQKYITKPRGECVVNRGKNRKVDQMRTFSHIRKHKEHMTPDELHMCYRLTDRLRQGFTVSKHLLKRKYTKFNVEDIKNVLNKGKHGFLQHLVSYDERYIDGIWGQRLTIVIPDLDVYFGDSRESSKGKLVVALDISWRSILTSYFIPEDGEDSMKLTEQNEKYYNKNVEVRKFKHAGYMFTNKGIREDVRDLFDDIYKGGEPDSQLVDKLSNIENEKDGVQILEEKKLKEDDLSTERCNGLEYEYLEYDKCRQLGIEIMRKVRRMYETNKVKVYVKFLDIESKEIDVYVESKEDNKTKWNEVMNKLTSTYRENIFTFTFIRGSNKNIEYRVEEVKRSYTKYDKLRLREDIKTEKQKKQLDQQTNQDSKKNNQPKNKYNCKSIDVVLDYKAIKVYESVGRHNYIGRLFNVSQTDLNREANGTNFYETKEEINRRYTNLKEMIADSIPNSRIRYRKYVNENTVKHKERHLIKVIVSEGYEEIYRYQKEVMQYMSHLRHEYNNVDVIILEENSTLYRGVSDVNGIAQPLIVTPNSIKQLR